jgi:hypothetical protein
MQTAMTGKRFAVRADEKLSAFLELEAASVRADSVGERWLRVGGSSKPYQAADMRMPRA